MILDPMIIAECYSPPANPSRHPNTPHLWYRDHVTGGLPREAQLVSYMLHSFGRLFLLIVLIGECWGWDGRLLFVEDYCLGCLLVGLGSLGERGGGGKYGIGSIGNNTVDMGRGFHFQLKKKK
jgi:hypothetical protein